MNKEIYRLVYLSKNKIEGEPATINAEIMKILSISRIRNLSNGITGALMFNQGGFAQVLEGEKQPVQDTFERIQWDSRHTDVVILSFDTISERRFGDWSMAYVGENTSAINLLSVQQSDTDSPQKQMLGEKIYHLMIKYLHQSEKVTSQ